MVRTLVLSICASFFAVATAGCGGDADDDLLPVEPSPEAHAADDLLPVEPSPEADPAEDLLPVEPSPEADPADDLLPVEPTPETTPEPDDEPREGPDDVACLVGTWELKAEDYVAQLNEVASAAGPGSLEYGGGRYLVEFGADGSFGSRQEAFTLRVVTAEGTAVATIDSVGSGTYSVSDTNPGDFEGELTVVEDGGDATVSMGFEMEGVVVPMPEGIPMTFDFPTSSLEGTARYICFDDAPATLGTGATLDDGSTIVAQFSRP